MALQLLLHARVEAKEMELLSDLIGHRPWSGMLLFALGQRMLCSVQVITTPLPSRASVW